jgi:hypothetical protein
MLLWGVMEWGIGGLAKSCGVGKGTAICRVEWVGVRLCLPSQILFENQV